MSSRILTKVAAETAGPMFWRQLNPKPPELDSDEETDNGPSEDGSTNERIPGPSAEQVHSLETRIAQLQHEIPVREQQARQTGFHEGEAAAQKVWSAAIEKAARAAIEIASLRSRLRREAEEDVIRLASAMARRVLRREVTMDPDAMISILRTTLQRVEQREVQRVRVRPEDAPTVSAWLERIGSPARIDVISDPSLERGGLVVECERGQMDASVETQLEEIERGFADVLAQRRGA
jgi:flagellar assembly protein FliH